MPQHKPFGATSNPNHRVIDATEYRVLISGGTRPNRTPLNDPG
jgi:hypothetical protein